LVRWQRRRNLGQNIWYLRIIFSLLFLLKFYLDVGANFSPSGLWTDIEVFFGNDNCAISKYHSSDTVVVCTVPECRTHLCINGGESWSGSETVSVAVYVATVEGIVYATTTYTYSGSYTPWIFQMSHSTYATSTSFVDLRTWTSSLSDISISLNGEQSTVVSGASVFKGGNYTSSNGTVVSVGVYYCDTGIDNELNSETFSNFWSWEKFVYYRPPDDMTGGFYNITVKLQNFTGYVSTGIAETFPVHKYSPTYYYFYNFQSTLLGTVYSLGLFPVVTSVAPAVGSLAGGTVVKIRGAGFSIFSR
jgi:hypothetical protein